MSDFRETVGGGLRADAEDQRLSLVDREIGVSHAAVDIDRVSGFQPHRFVAIRVNDNRPLQHVYEFLAFVLQQRSELFQRARLQSRHHRDHAFGYELGAQQFVFVSGRTVRTSGIPPRDDAASGMSWTAALEQIGDLDAEAGSEARQSVVGRRHLPVLDLRKRGDRQAGQLGHLAERQSALRTDRTEPQAEVGEGSLAAMIEGDDRGVARHGFSSGLGIFPILQFFHNKPRLRPVGPTQGAARMIPLTSRPRARLCHLPTPIEYLERLSAHLGGPRIFIKRDDATGLAFGGNKARKLEFILGDARRAGADLLLTAAGVQSNHARQTAAAAARFGMSAELVLARMVPYSSPDYEMSGNVLLDRLLGATTHIVDRGTD